MTHTVLLTIAALIGALVAALLAPFTSVGRDSVDHVVAITMCMLLVGIPIGVVAYSVLRAAL